MLMKFSYDNQFPVYSQCSIDYDFKELFSVHTVADGMIGQSNERGFCSLKGTVAPRVLLMCGGVHPSKSVVQYCTQFGKLITSVIYILHVCYYGLVRLSICARKCDASNLTFPPIRSTSVTQWRSKLCQ